MSEDRVRINNQETPVLQKFAGDIPENGLILEIGACWGYSAAKMAEASLDSVRIITIDPWTLSKNKQQPAREKKFHETIAPFKDRIIPVKAFSWDVNLPSLEAVLGAKLDLDLLFIDGDHSYGGVRKDYEKYGGLVKQGGLIVFHDYGYWDGVTNFVDETVAGDLWDYFTVHRFWVGTRL